MILQFCNSQFQSLQLSFEDWGSTAVVLIQGPQLLGVCACEISNNIYDVSAQYYHIEKPVCKIITHIPCAKGEL